MCVFSLPKLENYSYVESHLSLTPVYETFQFVEKHKT